MLGPELVDSSVTALSTVAIFDTWLFTNRFLRSSQSLQSIGKFPLQSVSSVPSVSSISVFSKGENLCLFLGCTEMLTAS